MAGQKSIIRLQESNIKDYLKLRASVVPFAIKNIKKIELVEQYSNSNYLFKLFISKPKSIYYLKQGWIYNRRSELQNKPFPVDPTRILGEVKLIRLLSTIWDKDCVPQVYFLDRKNYAFLMSDVSKTGKLLIEEFNHNRVHPEIAKKLAVYLAKLHTLTWKTKTTAGCSRRYTKFMKEYLFKYHWGYGANKLLPFNNVSEFFSEVENTASSIIWADPIYRNIFVKPEGKLALVDFDFTIRYDPMADVAILLSHWVWMLLKGNKEVSKDCHKFIKTFSSSYWPVWIKVHKISNQTMQQMKLRTDKWIGIYLLSRTDGKSGSYFKKWPSWEKRIRQLGIKLFNGEASIF